MPLHRVFSFFLTRHIDSLLFALSVMIGCNTHLWLRVIKDVAVDLINQSDPARKVFFLSSGVPSKGVTYNHGEHRPT